VRLILQIWFLHEVSANSKKTAQVLQSTISSSACSVDGSIEAFIGVAPELSLGRWFVAG